MVKKNMFPCLHCDTLCPKENAFCCIGCKAVYTLLKQYQLDDFYKIKKMSPSLNESRPVIPTNTSFSYLDSDDILSKYSSNQGLTMPFYIEGIHCNACIWLIEKLPSLVNGLTASQVHIGENVLVLTRKPEGCFADSASLLDKLGYAIYLYEEDNKDKIRKATVKSSLMRIGISAACTANIMILSISIYAGLQGHLKLIFEWLSAFLLLPVLGYCSLPFFKSALSSLRLGVFNIDISVSIALLFGGTVSLYNLISGSGVIYFDSLSMFVFLLLSVRYLFVSSYQKADLQTALTASLIPFEATLITSQIEKSVLSASLKPKDTIRVEPDSVIPVDGIIQTPAYVDVHILTGESFPIKKVPGNKVLAGMRNMGDSVEIVVEKAGGDTKLGGLIRQVKTMGKPKMVLMADKVAHWFLLLTTMLCMILFSYHTWWRHDMQLGIESALALIVLACPCALSLATPLAFSLSINRAAKEGICIQSPTALEALTQVKTIFFDKTGTLTKGCLSVAACHVYQALPYVYDLLYELERDSSHPIASSIRSYLLEQKLLSTQVEVTNKKEKVGVGVFGSYCGDDYKVVGTHAAKEGITSVVGMYKNDLLIAELVLSDTLQPDACFVAERLRQLGFDMAVLSGDQASCVETVSAQLGIATHYSRLSPDGKVALVEKTPHVLMVGDGANDTEAMMRATVSIAVQGSFEASLKAADIYFVSTVLATIPKVIEIARKTKRIVHTNFVFSLGYNVFGIILVVFGYIHPLIAAILMPLSSITVILYSWARLKTRP